MKVAISGKGGTGKSTVASTLALLLAQKQWRVVAVDADPDGNLAAAMGVSAEESQHLQSIAQQRALIETRTGTKPREYGQSPKLNPEVSDLAESFGVNVKGVSLLVLGAVETGGSGCACAESVVLQALVSELVLHREEAVILDMAAGIEHLGRGTAQGVDTMLVMVEPSQRALDSARRVARLAAEIGLRDIRFVANKVASLEDADFIRRSLAGREIAGLIPWSEEIILAERQGRSVAECAGPGLLSCFETLLEHLQRRPVHQDRKPLLGA